MGDIGHPQRRVEIIPTTEPVIAPPAEPDRRSAPLPVEPTPRIDPTKEPV